MYTVFCDGTKIYDLYTELHLIDPVLTLELNSPGSLEFTMPPDHPYFDLPQKMLSRVWVEHDGEEVFRGRVIEEETDFYNQKKIYCEGELAFLNDSLQRPAEYHNLSVRDYFKTMIELHNEQVEEDKQFEIGIVLISDDNDDVYRYTNYNSTLQEMKEDLVDDFGGYIRVRNENGHRYLDYVDIDNYGERNDQAIRFGVNLLDYTQTMDASDIATVIVPLGERLEESPIEALDMRLTIESVNGGSDAIESEEAVKTYGRVEKTVIWDDVTLASNLLAKGKKYLSDYQWDNMILEVSPVDLHDTDVDTETFHLGDQLRVISSPHGLDRFFPVSAMTIHLDSLDQNTFTLGTEIQGRTLSSKVRSTTDSVKQVEEEITPTQVILNQAKEQANNLIKAATHGHVVMQPNDSPEEILIMDTADTSTAKKLWRWNLNGLGYSSNGYDGNYGTAITMDGAIVADYITTGTLTANLIKTGKIQDVKGTNSWDMDNGTLTINTKQFTLDSSGNATFMGKLSAAQGTFTSLYTGSHSSYSSTASGFYAGDSGISLGANFKVSSSGSLTASSGTIGGWTIGSDSLYSGTTSMTSKKTGVYLGTDGIRSAYYTDDGSKNYLNIQYGALENIYSNSNWMCRIKGNIHIYEGDQSNHSRSVEISPNDIAFYHQSYGGWFQADNDDGKVIIQRDSGGRFEINGNYLYGRQHDYQTSTYWLRISNSNQSIYANGSYLTGSDMALKSDIQPLSSNDYDNFFDRLQPKIYCLKESDEVHMGFVYQDVVEEMEESGIDPEESALVEEIEMDEETHETIGAIAYNEIIALLVHEVQGLKSEVKELKAKLL